MYRIKIISVGKNKEPWLISALTEYEKRLTGQMRIEWILKKTDAELEKAAIEEKNFYCLDPLGISYTSEQFSTFVTKQSTVTFLIGGAMGISSKVKSLSQGLISLSSLTFTHQHTRLILIEQLYRALEIQKGTEYHK